MSEVKSEFKQPTLNNYVVGVLRITFGWYMLWSFLDKAFGLEYNTPKSNAWVDGGSPTFGFLQFGTAGGTFESTFQGMADNVLVEWIFMMGLLGIGLSLILGIGVRIAGFSGVLMMFFMYLAVLPFETLGDDHNPFVDDHIMNLMIFLFFGTYKDVGNHLGFGSKWQNLEIVKKFPILA